MSGSNLSTFLEPLVHGVGHKRSVGALWPLPRYLPRVGARSRVKGVSPTPRSGVDAASTSAWIRQGRESGYAAA